MPRPAEQFTDADLRDQYARAELAWPFEVGIRKPGIRTFLINGIRARRHREARLAQAAAIPHQIPEET